LAERAGEKVIKIHQKEEINKILNEYLKKEQPGDKK
jgi:hypothetical protein